MFISLLANSHISTNIQYLKLRTLQRASYTHYFYEATVGAGLPIISTLRGLLETGDKILRIEGIFRCICFQITRDYFTVSLCSFIIPQTDCRKYLYQMLGSMIFAIRGVNYDISGWYKVCFLFNCSGTLSYIFNNFQGTRTFSNVVAEAKEAGYTEPDPRDDLSGTDVARKVELAFY